MQEFLAFHSPVGRHLGCFHFGVIMNKAAMCLQMFSFLLSKYLGVIYVELSKKLPNFPSACLYFYKFPPVMHEHSSVFSMFWPKLGIIRFLTSIIIVRLQRCLFVVFICMSLKTNNVEHFFMSFFLIHWSSLMKCLLKYFAHF